MAGFGDVDLISGLLSQAGSDPQGTFEPTKGFRKNTRDTTPQAGRNIGELGGFPVGQIDVRTPLMQVLEQASAPLLLNLLLNPQAVQQHFASAAGSVPGAPQSSLASFLFGDAPPSAPQGPPSGSQVPPGGGGTPPVPAIPTPGTQVRPRTGPTQTPVPENLPPEITELLDELTRPPVVPPPELNPVSPQDVEGGLPINDLTSPFDLFGPMGDIRQDRMRDRLLGGLVGIDFKQGGGLLDPNKLTVVGEQGPELITPNLQGQQQVLPLQQGQAPTNAFATSAQQGPGTGAIQQLLQQNPEGQTLNIAGNILGGEGGILGGGTSAGQGVVDALQPVFRQNLQFGLNELTNRVPSVRNSGAAIQGADLTSRALNDFNLLAAQALQQGQSNTLGGLGLLGQLASSAGGGQFGRSLQAGQLATQRDLGLGSLGLQAQQQAFNQAVNPTLQLLLAAMGMATPTAFQTVVPGKK